MSFAKYLSDTDIEVVQNFLNENMDNLPMTTADIYEQVKNNLESDVNLNVFRNSFGANIKAGRLTGVEAKRRVGVVPVGYVPASKAKVAPIKTHPKEEIKQLNKTEPVKTKKTTKNIFEAPERRISRDYKFARHVWIDNKLYRVNQGHDKLEQLVTFVIGGKQDLNGRIIFNGIKWHCDDYELFERFLKHMLFAIYERDCEPVLNDDSGLSVELLIRDGKYVQNVA